MSKELAVAGNQGLFPTGDELETMQRLGALAVKSGFLPQSVNTPEKAVIIMLKGKELGIGPMHAFSSISVIQGRPTMSAELMLSLIYRNIPGAIVNFVITTEIECHIEATRPLHMPTTFSFTIDDAKRAKLVGKGNWLTYPAAMLRARCISSMARAMFPDALSGVVYTPEEMESVDVREVKQELLDKVTKVNDQSSPVTKADFVPEPEAKLTPSRPTKEQVKRIFGLGDKHNWDLNDIKVAMKQKFNRDATSDLTWVEYVQLCQEIERNPKDNKEPAPYEPFPFEATGSNQNSP